MIKTVSFILFSILFSFSGKAQEVIERNIEGSQIPSISEKKKPRVLVFSKIGEWRNPEHTKKGYHHASIPAGQAMLSQLASDHDFDVVFDPSSALFTDEGLAPFDAVIFLNPNGYILDDEERLAFQNYFRRGKGYVGIHAAANCELNWPWYMQMIGAYETGVHAHKTDGTIVIQDDSHASTRNLPKTFIVHDEWLKYNVDVRTLNDDEIKVLAVVEEASYRPGATTNHAIAWYREFEGGRVWYTGFGHHPSVFSDPQVIEHIWGGIQYAIGNKDSN